MLVILNLWLEFSTNVKYNFIERKKTITSQSQFRKLVFSKWITKVTIFKGDETLVVMLCYGIFVC